MPALGYRSAKQKKGKLQKDVHGVFGRDLLIFNTSENRKGGIGIPAPLI